MSNCPCCNGNLLRHICNSRIYWFCLACRQEMPDLTLAIQPQQANQNIPEAVRIHQPTAMRLTSRCANAIEGI